MRRTRLAVPLLVSVAAITVATVEGIAGDPRAGREFAVRNCAGCHSIGPTGSSPNANAPTFRTIARRYRLQDLEEGLAEGIVTGHSAMPEFVLTPRQIDDLLAHLGRLKRGE
jgi:mono/diheme cytochrome c family protein